MSLKLINSSTHLQKHSMNIRAASYKNKTVSAAKTSGFTYDTPLLSRSTFPYGLASSFNYEQWPVIQTYYKKISRGRKEKADRIIVDHVKNALKKKNVFGVAKG